MHTAYQILMADSPEALKANNGTVWDTGKIASDASIQVAYIHANPVHHGFV